MAHLRSIDLMDNHSGEVSLALQCKHKRCGRRAERVPRRARTAQVDADVAAQPLLSDISRPILWLGTTAQTCQQEITSAMKGRGETREREMIASAHSRAHRDHDFMRERMYAIVARAVPLVQPGTTCARGSIPCRKGFFAQTSRLLVGGMAHLRLRR